MDDPHRNLECSGVGAPEHIDEPTVDDVARIPNIAAVYRGGQILFRRYPLGVLQTLQRICWYVPLGDVHWLKIGRCHGLGGTGQEDAYERRGKDG